MSLFQRTMKLVLATVLAIFVADFLHLTYATSAGIIALLSILNTRRSSAKLAFKRFMSTLLALALGCLMFLIGGFELWSLAAYLVVFVPLSYYWRLEAGIAPSSVLVTHLYLEKSLRLDLIQNEIMLFVIGAGMALLFNSYMSSNQAKIDYYHVRVEKELKDIMLRFSLLLKEGDGTNNGFLINAFDKTLKEAAEVVYLERHNQVFRTTDYHVHYFRMRMEQNRVLRQMAEIINRLALKTPESIILAQLFQEVAYELSQENSGLEQLEAIDDFLVTFRQRELPKTRQEFENRAILFQLLNDMKLFIQMKVDFYCDYQIED